MYQNSFGTTIRELRQQQKMTQADLGKIVGVSTQAVSKWERGSIPDISILIVLADYFHISLDELIGRDAKNFDYPGNRAYAAVLNTDQEQSFRVAADTCWSVVKGLTKITDLDSMGYSPSTTQESSRFRVSSNAGVSYGIVSEKLQAISLMPEPEDGFEILVKDPDALTALFRFLGDRDTMLLFLFIGRRSTGLFTAELASREADVSLGRTQKILDAFVQRGWLTEETAGVVDGSMHLYRGNLRENYLFFLLYAQEMLLLPRFWYLSSFTSRTKPLLNSALP